MNHTDHILNTPAVCKILGISRPTLWRWCRDGLFPRSIQLGPRRVGFRASDVQAWLDSRAEV